MQWYDRLKTPYGATSPDEAVTSVLVPVLVETSTSAFRWTAGCWNLRDTRRFGCVRPKLQSRFSILVA